MSKDNIIKGEDKKMILNFPIHSMIDNEFWGIQIYNPTMRIDCPQFTKFLKLNFANSLSYVIETQQKILNSF